LDFNFYKVDVLIVFQPCWNISFQLQCESKKIPPRGPDIFSFFSQTVDWIGLSMILRLRQHNIGYTADGFYG